ncbi:MAG: ABC transporter permease subunit [Pseudonocardiaceae bacterium]|nr:ABC transporter permease subunit [Pseudonocardiaceae bacterium]
MNAQQVDSFVAPGAISATSSRRKRSLDPFGKIQWPVAICGVLLFVSPVIMIVVGAFRTTPFTGGRWTLDAMAEVFTNPATYRASWETASIAVVTVLISMVIAIFFVTLSTRTNSPLRGLIPAMMAFVVAMPPLFYGISWGLLGNQTSGLLNEFITVFWAFDSGPVNAESWWGLVAVSALRSVGFQYFLLLGAFMAMDRSLEEAARLSGASPVRAFFTVQLPVLFPAIGGVTILSLIVFLESFDIPAILGIPAGIYVLPTEVFNYLNSGAGPEYARASALSLILITIMLLLVYLQYRMMGRRSFVTVSGKGDNHGTWDLGRWRWPAALAIVLYALFAAVLPVTQLVVGSLAPFMGASSGFSFDNFAEVLENEKIMYAFGLTAIVAAVGAAIAVLVSFVMLWAAKLRRGVPRTLIGTAQWLPAALPGIVLGLGVLWFFLLLPPLRGLVGTPFSLVFAMVISVIPLAGRAVEGAIAQVPMSLEEASWASGANKFTALTGITARIMSPSLINGWLLSFVVLSGTLAIPLLLSSTTGGLLSVHVYKAYTAGRVELAAAIFVLLMIEILLVTALAVIVRVLLQRKRATYLGRPQVRGQEGNLNDENTR